MNHPRIKDFKIDTVCKNWHVIKNATFKYKSNKGVWVDQTREAYDRGNGAGILLYNKEHQTVILTEQFRLPTYINGNDSGLLIEVCAGLLDVESPEECIKRETEEETGFRIDKVEKVMEAYMSPGSVTEILYLFIAEYDKSMKISEGGGVASESEEIEVLEMKFEEAMAMVKSGAIRDAKTIMLIQYAALNKIFSE